MQHYYKIINGQIHVNQRLESEGPMDDTWIEYNGLHPLDSDMSDEAKEIVRQKISNVSNDEMMKQVRKERTQLLAETDWMSNSDVIMSDDWKTYRQALRDLPANSNPKLQKIDENSDNTGGYEIVGIPWPTKPE
tara:strand:+ start:495 stop:896 length:402 start_codon:yes stop_codon:yes gene_type:complete